MSAHPSEEMPDGWGFCSNRSCPCWHSDGEPCEEFAEFDPHPFQRCARCGVQKDRHSLEVS